MIEGVLEEENKYLSAVINDIDLKSNIPMTHWRLCLILAVAPIASLGEEEQ